VAVLAEGFSVIATLDAVERRYSGGRQAYVSDCPNRTYCEDDLICRVGFMSATDALEWVYQIEKKGLVIGPVDEFVDVALVDSLNGQFGSCAWIELERDQSDILWVKQKNDSSSVRSAHEGFNGERMLFTDAKDVISMREVKEKQWWQFWC